jgi:archaellum biogenesis protein FlaJ (TadC family)
MSPRNVSNKQIRDIQRITHLVAALVLVLYVYIPLGSAPLLTTVLQFAVLPLLAVTGMLMWQWTRLSKRFTPFLRSALMP